MSKVSVFVLCQQCRQLPGRRDAVMVVVAPTLLPMLPPSLSPWLCCLLKHEDRYGWTYCMPLC